jgi:hypothetical protein
MIDQREAKSSTSAVKWVRVLSATFALACVVAVSVASSAFAAVTDPVAPPERRLLDEAIGGRCVPDAAKEVLRSYRERILNASTVDDARSLVLSQTRLAHAALDTASWVLPFSDSVRQAREKIESLEGRVYAANSPTEVAADFSEFLAPNDNDGALAGATANMVLADVNLDKTVVRTGSGGGGCDYTTGEVVIIVLGFIFFIIPGIIFLIIFC